MRDDSLLLMVIMSRDWTATPVLHISQDDKLHDHSVRWHRTGSMLIRDVSLIIWIRAINSAKKTKTNLLLTHENTIVLCLKVLSVLNLICVPLVIVLSL